jgi:hypothetical protein
MNRISNCEKMLRKSGMFLLMMAIPTFVLGQHKNEPSKPSAPAPHASAPAAHTSAPSHAAPQSHSSAQSHTGATGHAATTGNKPGQAGNKPGQAGNKPGQAGNKPGQAGNKPGQAGNKPGQAGNKPGQAGNKPGGSTHQPAGTKDVSLKGGGKASVRANGSVRSIDRGGMHIEHGVHGGSRVVGEHNGARVVNTGRHGGYVQRAYVTRGGRSYYSRTFYAGGRYHVGLYRGYGWGGRTYYGYYPGVWYHPGFYGWGYQPWGVSVAWGIGAWGWGGSPWYGLYGGWWNPYPVYAAPYYWLTDYLISQQLQAAYAARAEANADGMAADASASGGGGDAAPAAASSQVALTPEVKEAIAQEVKAQLAAQQSQAGQDSGGQSASAAPAPTSDQPPPALDPSQRTFVVDADVTVVANGQECGLTSGDVITRLTDTPDADQTVNASVSATKKGDCGSGQTVAVKVDDLQEMYNHFQENITNGMGELAKKQGTGGMPKAPDTGTQAGAVPPPQPDNTAAKALQDQQAAADQTESQVKQETASGGGTQ